MIKPLPGYCLVEPIEDDMVSNGGVYVPETSKDKPMKGKVIAVGEGIPSGKFEKNMQNWYEPILYDSPVSVGQIAFYKKWTNQEVQYKGKEYLLVNFNELLAVIE